MKVACPECKNGRVGGIACSSQGCRVGDLPCPLCDGSGRVDVELVARRVEGRRLRNCRVAAGRVLREFAKLADLTALQVSEIERGKTAPTESVRVLYESLERAE